MRLVFYRPRDLVGHLICLRTGGVFSHVAVETDGWRFEATSKDGVRAIPAVAWPGDCAYVELGLSPEQKDKAEAFLLKCCSEEDGYDFWGIVNYLFNTKRQNPSRYFCSELCYDCLVAAGLLSPADKLISPQELYEIAKNKICSPR